ncbi:hypothetical protein NKH94_26470 [Mesorhizobium australicum]|uniref:hypothetical protein n=1 Tax=Mesorhizobium australicum TaxID=536018 RepID=UPI0033352FD3
MDYSFTATGGDGLMPLAISFVGKTFGSDPAASRNLVERLLHPKRMAEHAPSDMHWLAQEASRIAEVDPELVISIYDKVFRHVIKDDSPTQLGRSQILPMTSNRRQDFKLAQWALKEKFPDFMQKHPLAAVSAAVKVARAYRDNEHPLIEAVEVLSVKVGDVEAKLCPDLSYIWAAEHKAQYSDDAQEIVDSFVDRLLQAPDQEAVAFAKHVIATNELGWLWARLFSVAAQRGGALAAMLWPWAAQIEFLQSPDAMKDAVDLVAAGYSDRSTAERIDLENRVSSAGFPNASDPMKAEQRFQRRVFGTIGAEGLATENAKQVLQAAIAQNSSVSNEPLYRGGEAEWIATGNFDWLREKGVDTESAENSPILDAIEASGPKATNDEPPSPRIAGAKVLQARLLHSPLTAHPMTIAHGWEQLTRTIEDVTHKWETVQLLSAEERSFVGSIIANVNTVASLAPLGDPEVGKRCRANLAGAAMNVARLDNAIALEVESSIIALAADSSPDVRFEIAWRLQYLWNVRRQLAWKLVGEFIATEQDARVLLGVVDFLIRAANVEPEHVGAIANGLLSRKDILEDDNRRGLREGVGSLIFHLWVRHGQGGARDAIDHWLANRLENKIELGKGAFYIREGLVLGYEQDNATENATRERCQKLAFEIIDTSALGVEAFMSADANQHTDEKQAEASNDAALLDKMADQFLFAVGPTEIKNGKEPRALRSLDEQRRFIQDNSHTLRRVGDAGIPKTIHYMLQLLDYLMSSAPGPVFDLVSHALLRAGKLHGYQFESLGADLFAKIVGRAIADHREIFTDPVRRVILVETLEVFVDAGWPAARRLLYRLPEALR